MSFDPVQSSADANVAPLESLEALGSLLRQTREARGLSLTEVSQDTFIRTQYLDALERGDLSLLPEAVYIQGFLKRYADYLGLQGDRLQKQAMSLFQTHKTLSPPANTALPRQTSMAIPLRPMHLWTIYVVVVVFAVGVLSALLEGRTPSLSRWLRVPQTASTDSDQPQNDRQPNEPESTPDSASLLSASLEDPAQPALVELPESSQGSPQPSQPSLAEVFSASQEETPSSATDRPVNLDIRVVDRPSWLRVIADGRVEFEGTLQPGAERNWSADQSIVVRAGNAGGVLVTFNNEDLGVMGSFGEVKERVFQRPLDNAQVQ